MPPVLCCGHSPAVFTVMPQYSVVLTAVSTLIRCTHSTALPPVRCYTHSTSSSTLLYSQPCLQYSAILTGMSPVLCNAHRLPSLQYSTALTPMSPVLCSTHSYTSSSSSLIFSQTCSSTLLDSQPCLLPVFCCTHSHASSTLPYSKSISNLMMYS